MVECLENMTWPLQMSSCRALSNTINECDMPYISKTLPPLEMLIRCCDVDGINSVYIYSNVITISMYASAL